MKVLTVSSAMNLVTTMFLLLMFTLCQSSSSWESSILGRTTDSRKWWTLYHYRLTNLRQTHFSSIRKLFSRRQWRQFRGFELNGRRSRHYIDRDLIEAAVTGLKRAITECRYQFAKERWNCSLLVTGYNGQVMGSRLLNKGVPETAFVYALLSASIVQTVAEACLSRIAKCPCDNRGRLKNPGDQWQWQGCDHNVHFGRKFARRLLDSAENGLHISYLMNLHNNEAGRQHVMKNMKNYCRCHGTSGSCTLRTCFRKTDKFHNIGNLLKKRYLQAVRVRRDNTIPQPWDYPRRKGKKGKKGRRRKPRRLGLYKTQLDRYGRLEHPANHELVYFERPPREAFCESNSQLETWGTHGRRCNSTSPDSDNCDSLCCSRGYTSNSFYEYEPCNCRFVWCCNVECEKCVVYKTHDTCK